MKGWTEYAHELIEWGYMICFFVSIVPYYRIRKDFRRAKEEGEIRTIHQLTPRTIPLKVLLTKNYLPHVEKARQLLLAFWVLTAVLFALGFIIGP